MKQAPGRRTKVSTAATGRPTDSDAAGDDPGADGDHRPARAIVVPADRPSSFRGRVANDAGRIDGADRTATGTIPDRPPARAFLAVKIRNISCENASNATPFDEANEDRSVILALVDELAFLAAELWFAGKFDHCGPEEESPDVDDDE
jgi:hypothetical protein